MARGQITKVQKLEEDSEIASLKLTLNEHLFTHGAADKVAVEAADGAGRTDREADEGLTDEVDKHGKERSDNTRKLGNGYLW